MEFTLEPWNLSHGADLAGFANNEALAQNLRDGFPRPYALSDAEAYIKSCMEKDMDRQCCRAIVAQGKAVGSIGLFLLDDIYRKSGEVGYMLSQAYWGHGIMTRAVREFCEFCFGQFDMVRIQAEVFSSNPASCRVLEKAGFTLEGIKRSSVCKDGRILDSHLYALVK